MKRGVSGVLVGVTRSPAWFSPPKERRPCYLSASLRRPVGGKGTAAKATGTAICKFSKKLIAMKNLIHRVLNLLLYLGFCAMLGTGLLMAYRLPPGSRGGSGLTVLGIDRHEWGDVHLWISYIFIAVVIAPLAMNWTWLNKIAASMKPLRLWGGLLVGIVIIVLLLLLPVHNRQLPRNQGHGRIHEIQEE
jgi:hypothetical protein